MLDAQTPCCFSTNPLNSKRMVKKRQAAFKRVEKALGTHGNSKLARCYSQTSREDPLEQGLETGKAYIDDMLEHNHEYFVWINPQYNPVNAR
jgi:acyl-CoA oxidase